MDFKKGDDVKFFFDWDNSCYYGKVLVVRERSCTVLVDNPDGSKERVTVSKRLINFD